jgi:hypothetical protein
MGMIRSIIILISVGGAHKKTDSKQKKSCSTKAEQDLNTIFNLLFLHLNHHRF